MENLVVEGKRPEGRSPMMRTDRLIEMTGPTMYETIHLAQSKHLIEDKRTDVSIISATSIIIVNLVPVYNDLALQ